MKMQTSSRAASYVILLATISLLPACGGSGGGSAVGTGSAVTSTGTLGTGGTGGTGSTASSGIAASASYSVSGAVTGLAKGKKIVLLNNGVDALTVNSNGTFTFNTPVADGASYTVTVSTQPDGQTCTASSNYSAAILADVINVEVVCSDQAVQVSGTIAGLPAGQQVVLVENMNPENQVTVASDGTFAFPEPVAEGSPATVTVAHKSVTESCTVTPTEVAGTVGHSGNINVNCLPSTLHTMASFSANGPQMTGSVVSDATGNLYGVNPSWGGNGAVIKVSPKGDVQIIYQFQGGNDGKGPNDGLVLDNDGNLYGTTRFGGPNSRGTVFMIAASAHDATYSKALLYAFDGSTCGSYTWAGLVMDKNGNLYGTTYEGGLNGPTGKGAVFMIVAPGSGDVTQSRSCKALLYFDNSPFGYYVKSSLTLDSKGYLYGVTIGGSTNRNGSLFRVATPGSTSGSLSDNVIYAAPQLTWISQYAPLVLDPHEEYIYAAASISTGTRFIRAVYKISVNFPSYQELCTIPGQLDNTGLVMDKNGQFLYGMTFGLYGQTIRQASGTGALFAVSVSTGKYQELHSFTGGADGSRPRGNLTLDSSGSYLYGTTSTGGANGNGTVFQF